MEVASSIAESDVGAIAVVDRPGAKGGSMFKSILVPIDVAHRSSWESALPQAIELAAGNGIVTVSPSFATSRPPSKACTSYSRLS